MRNSAAVYDEENETERVVNERFSNVSIDIWRYSPYLPDVINRNIRSLMSQKCLIFITMRTHDNPTTQYSIIDSHIIPDSSFEALLYIPRSIVIGLFYPTPASIMYAINVRPSIFYTIGPIETLAVYFAMASITVWLLFSRQWLLMVPLYFSIGMTTIFAMATPLIGTLYRYRYPWWMLLICLGIAAAIDLFVRYRAARRSAV